MTTTKMRKAIDKVISSCNMCASSGRPGNTTKLSLKHINKEFNNEVQADFLTIKTQERRYEVLNIVHTSTGYGKRTLVQSRSAANMLSKFEECWTYRQGSPQSFSAEPEFCQPFFVRYLHGQSTKINERPERSSHKNGRVERSNEKFISVVAKLFKEKTNVEISLLISRASFVTNIIFGSSKLNSFQLSRGYMPAVAGLPSKILTLTSKILTKELFDTYFEMNAYRAILKAPKSRVPNYIHRSSIKQGDTIYLFYKPTNKSLDVKWVTSTVINAKEHFDECRRSHIGPPMRVAYEHVRLVPSNEISNKISESLIEEYIADIDTNNVRTLEGMSSQKNHNVYQDIFGTESESDEDKELEPIGTERSMLCSKVEGRPEKDIGTAPPTISVKSAMKELTSTEQQTLNKISDIVCGKHLTRSKMECAPSWLLDKALKEEVEVNWRETHEEVDERNIMDNANVIPSHVVYKVKNEENDVKRRKARLCPNGNRKS